nr:hypothetical protein [Tanacetum cinerariifolium]
MTKFKSFNRSPKQRALYQNLMESILEDEDVMDEAIADKLNKRKHDDADKDEGPYARSDRGLKRLKRGKDTKPPKKTKSTEASKGTSKSQPKSTATSKHDWFKKPERPPTPDSNWNVRKSIDFRPPQTWINKIDKLTQEHLVGPTFNLLKGTCKSRVELEYNFEECSRVSGGGSSSKKCTTSTSKTRAGKYDIPGIEYMVPLLWSPNCSSSYCFNPEDGLPAKEKLE